MDTEPENAPPSTDTSAASEALAESQATTATRIVPFSTAKRFMRQAPGRFPMVFALVGALIVSLLAPAKLSLPAGFILDGLPSYIFLGLAAVILIVGVPRRQVRAIQDPLNRLQAETAARQVLVQGLAGLAFTLGFLSTWSQIYLQSVVVNRDTRTATEKEKSDRLTMALGYLAGNSISIRVAGVYLLRNHLESLPDSAQTIDQILVSFVRASQFSPPPKKPEVVDLLSVRLPPDVEAALVLLGRERPSDTAFLDGPDLSNLDLRGAKLRKLNFSGATFFRSRLDGADLVLADLNNAILVEASVREANLASISLSKAWLHHTDFSDAFLKSANLTGAQIQSTVFKGTSLSNARLNEASICGADLRGADFLTVEQLATTKTIDGTTQLASGLRNELVEKGKIKGDQCLLHWLIRPF